MSDARAPRELTVPATHQGERLDRALSSLWPEHSRSEFRRWIEEGRVRTGERVLDDPSHRVRGGDVLVITPAAPLGSDALPEPMELSILHEDDELVVLVKPAGLVVHPAPGHPSGTLVNGLLHRYGALAPSTTDDEDDEETIGPPRPGIVHRLDRWTSGVMVVARTPRAREGLAAQWRVHSIERAYLAIAFGAPPAATTFDTLHGRHPADRKRFTTKVREGRRAVTHLETIERFEGASLVRCRLETGRTHQIRVHLAEAGYPLLGDPVYGRAPEDEFLRGLATSLGRQALHATVLGFDHPVSGARLRFESPMPADLAAVVDALRQRPPAPRRRSR